MELSILLDEYADTAGILQPATAVDIHVRSDVPRRESTSVEECLVIINEISSCAFCYFASLPPRLECIFLLDKRAPAGGQTKLRFVSGTSERKTGSLIKSRFCLLSHFQQFFLFFFVLSNFVSIRILLSLGINRFLILVHGMNNVYQTFIPVLEKVTL